MPAHRLKLADLPLTDVTGQRYACVGLRDRKTRGKPTTPLAIVETRCFDCGAPFRQLVFANAAYFIPARRCREHKRPGVPVITRRKAEQTAAPLTLEGGRAAKAPAPATVVAREDVDALYRQEKAARRERNARIMEAAKKRKAALMDGLGAFS